MKKQTGKEFRDSSQAKPNWFKNTFIPAVAKMGNQRHLAAIRDAFGTMIPLIIAGSMGMLINAIVFGGAGSGYVSLLGVIAKASHSSMSWVDVGTQLIGNQATVWGQISTIMGFAFGSILTVTIGMMSIYFAFLFGYFIALSRDFSNPVITGLVSIASFVLACLGKVEFFMDAKGLITAIIFGLISSEIFIKLSSVRALNIKLPDGVPPAVGKSFAVFLPVVITLASIAAINILVFAPAIITKDLYVSSGAFDTTTLTHDHVQEYLNSIKSNISSISDPTVLNNPFATFAQYQNELNILASHTTNVDDFVKYVSSLTGEHKSIVASFLSSMDKNIIIGNGVGNMVSPEELSNVKLTLLNNGDLSVALSWQAISIDSSQFGMGEAIYQFITSWFIKFATGDGALGIAIIFVFFVGFFWFFGIHGANIMAGIFEPIFWMVLGINTALVAGAGSYEAAAATGQMGVFTKPFFDSYMYVGGSGATLGLLITTMIFSKRQELKEVARYSTPAGIFQINEPAIFGYPIILNPIYITPFIMAPIFNTFVGWIFSPDVLNFVHYSTVASPWTAPWFVSAMITSLDIRAIIPALIVFGLDLVLYFPFILIDNKLYFKKLKANNPEEYELKMKYFNDPEYKFGVDTNTKVERINNKAELVLMDAMTINDFWAKKMTNPEKLKIRQDGINSKAEIKKENYISKANALKIKREELELKLKPKWELKKQKKETKLAAKN